MRLLVFALCICLIFSANAICDETYKFAQITFVKELGFLDVKARSIGNIGKYLKEKKFEYNKKNIELLANKYGLYLGSHSYGPIEFEEAIGNNNIKIRIEYEKERASGQCGANPPAIINIWLNGKELIKNVLFHQECFDRPSIDEVSIKYYPEGPLINFIIAKNKIKIWEEQERLF